MKWHYMTMSVTPDKVAEILRKHSGVVRVEIPDRNFLCTLEEDDLCVDTSFGMPIDNKAMDACLACDFVLCVFANTSFEQPSDKIMMMQDSSGLVLGHDVAPSQMDEYMAREDLIWLSEDFVIYPSTEMGDDIILVMLPQIYNGFSEEDGVSEAVIFYPATTTDSIIKEKYGEFDDPQIATLLMGIKLK